MAVKHLPGSQQLPKLALREPGEGIMGKKSCFFWERGSRDLCEIKDLPKPTLPDSDHCCFLSCFKGVLGE